MDEGWTRVAKPVPWGRVLIEGVVIVSSILLAFGLQAWWEGRGEAERREVLLRGLSSDFAAAEVELARVSGVHERMLSASADLVTMARSAAPPGPAQAPLVDSLVSTLFYTPTFDAPVGTLQAILNAGGLDVLPNAALVSELSAWSAIVADMVEDELGMRQQLETHLLPYLRDNMISTADLVWDDPGWAGVPWVPEHTNAYRLLSDPRFEGIVSERWFFARDAIDAEKRVHESLARIQTLIAAELDASP